LPIALGFIECLINNVSTFDFELLRKKLLSKALLCPGKAQPKRPVRESLMKKSYVPRQISR